MSEASGTRSAATSSAPDGEAPMDPDLRLVAELALPSEPGNERVAMDRVAAIARSIGLDADRTEQLKTAVAEAALNALEHGNRYRPELEVHVEVLVSPDAMVVRITDHGKGGPAGPQVIPNLDAKLSGEQSPRGWGLFLIQKMVDSMRVSGDEHHHTIELTIRRQAAEDPGGEH